MFTAGILSDLPYTHLKIKPQVPNTVQTFTEHPEHQEQLLNKMNFLQSNDDDGHMILCGHCSQIMVPIFLSSTIYYKLKENILNDYNQ